MVIQISDIFLVIPVIILGLIKKGEKSKDSGVKENDKKYLG
jgi:hypothetical protein